MPLHFTTASTCAVLIGLCTAAPAGATPFFFSTGDPDGKMATASRPSSAGKFEIESGDDFVLTGLTSITSATFTGLLTGNASVGEVRVEIYRVFPKDSDTSRTPNVPTRANSPSDVEFDDRDSASGNLNFMTTDLGMSSVLNSVQPGGIHGCPCPPAPTTGGDGSLTGEEVAFGVTFTTSHSSFTVSSAKTGRRKRTQNSRPTIDPFFEKCDAVSPSNRAVVCVPLAMRRPYRLDAANSGSW